MDVAQRYLSALRLELMKYILRCGFLLRMLLGVMSFTEGFASETHQTNPRTMRKKLKEKFDISFH